MNGYDTRIVREVVLFTKASGFVGGMFAEKKPVSRWKRKIKEELFQGCYFSITWMVVKQQLEKAETLQKVKSCDDLCKYNQIPWRY